MKGLVSYIAQLLVAHARTRGNPKGGTWPSVTTGEVSWHHFQSKGPTRANIAQHPVAHVDTQRNPEGVTWSLVTCGSPVGHALWYYCTTTLVRKKRETVGHGQNILPVTSGQDLFRSRDWRHFRWLPVTSLPVKHAQWSNPLDPLQMWLELCPYTSNTIHVYNNNIRVYSNNIRVYVDNMRVYIRVYNIIRVYYRANDMNGHSLLLLLGYR